jgi:hypothetical protein
MQPELENKMPTAFDINNLLKTLVSFAYPELQKKEVVVSWGYASGFGQVRWSDDDNEISIKINKSVNAWHEAGITGLLSHELSHPAQSGSGLKEMETDEDVIARGLGSYLAVERLLAGKYEDHIIRRGKDRYLGYRSIRDLLASKEIQNLDMLMSEMKLKPAQPIRASMISHDSVLYEKEGRSTISVNGYQFVLPVGLLNPDIKMVYREGIVLVYADEMLVGKCEEDVSL